MPIKETFKPLPDDFLELIAAFETEVDHTKSNVSDFEKRTFNGVREGAIIYSASHALDLAHGCLGAAKEGLPSSLNALCRALLETLIWAKYITTSEENAKEFIEASNNELKRVARKNLNAGYARIIDTSTDEDKTKQLLNDPLLKEIPRRKRIEDAARAAGLEKLYTTVYGFMSISAHGRAFGLLENSKPDLELYASLASALGILQCLNLVTSDWIIGRKPASDEKMSRILGISNLSAS